MLKYGLLAKVGYYIGGKTFSNLEVVSILPIVSLFFKLCSALPFMLDINSLKHLDFKP